jgi:hypothetical protein
MTNASLRQARLRARAIAYALGRSQALPLRWLPPSDPLTAGTLMEHFKLPLTTWFLAIHLISQDKSRISAVALKRDLGVSYPTVWLLNHKINGAMSRQEAARLLSGALQLDDAYLGEERSEGKPRRGSENKVPFVAPVSMNDAGQPIRLKLDIVSGFTSNAIAKWVKTSLMPKTIVNSDGRETLRGGYPLDFFLGILTMRIHPNNSIWTRCYGIFCEAVYLESPTLLFFHYISLLIFSKLLINLIISSHSI